MPDKETKIRLEQKEPELIQYFKEVSATAPLRFILAETRKTLDTFNNWPDADSIGRWAMQDRRTHHIVACVLESAYSAAVSGSTKLGIEKHTLVTTTANSAKKGRSRSTAYAIIRDGLERNYFGEYHRQRMTYVYATLPLLASHFKWSHSQAVVRKKHNLAELSKAADVNAMKVVQDTFEVAVTAFETRLRQKLIE